MWYKPRLVECKKCKRHLTQDEYSFNELTGKYTSTCIECITTKNNNSKRKIICLVKNSWRDAIFTLKGTKIKGSKIRMEHIKDVIDEELHFILRQSCIDEFYENKK